MEKKTKPGAIQQLLDYAGDNKKQLYFSTFLATLGELFGMAPFIAVSLLVSGLFNKTATIQNVLILFVVALGGQVLKLWLTYQSSFMSHKATYKILKNIRSTIADKMLRVPMGIMLDTPTGNFKNLMADTVSKLEDSMAHFMPEIQSAISKLVKGKTLIVVAHRLATIQNADQILVVENGKIVGCGGQEELLLKCPLYQRLWSDYVSSADQVEGGKV